jgi:hypothetical protein
MSEYSGGGYTPMTPANSARIWIRGNMYADRPEGPWYRIITPDEARKLFQDWKAKQ